MEAITITQVTPLNGIQQPDIPPDLLFDPNSIYRILNELRVSVEDEDDKPAKRDESNLKVITMSFGKRELRRLIAALVDRKRNVLEIAVTKD